MKLARARGSTRSRSQPSAASIPYPFARLERATVEPQPYRPTLVVLLARAPRHAWTSIQLAPNGYLRSRASHPLLISSSCSVRWPARSRDAHFADAPRAAFTHNEDSIAWRRRAPPGAGDIQIPAFEIVFETCAIHDVGVLTRAAQVSSICRDVAAPFLSSVGIGTLACSIVASRS